MQLPEQILFQRRCIETENRFGTLMKCPDQLVCTGPVISFVGSPLRLQRIWSKIGGILGEYQLVSNLESNVEMESAYQILLKSFLLLLSVQYC